MRFGGGRQELETLRNNYDELLKAIAEMNKFSGQIVIMLHKRESLSTEELTELIKHMTELAHPNLKAAMNMARKGHNPLTPNEAGELEGYIQKANQGSPFTSTEIERYRTLVEKAEQEPTGMNPWPLVALGAFLLGLLIGMQKK